MSQGVLGPFRPPMPDMTGVDFSNPEHVKRYMQSLTTAIAIGFDSRPAASTAQDGRLFRSPDGKSWKMSITNAGVPMFTQVGTESSS